MSRLTDNRAIKLLERNKRCVTVSVVIIILASTMLVVGKRDYKKSNSNSSGSGQSQDTTGQTEPGTNFMPTGLSFPWRTTPVPTDAPTSSLPLPVYTPVPIPSFTYSPFKPSASTPIDFSALYPSPTANTVKPVSQCDQSKIASDQQKIQQVTTDSNNQINDEESLKQSELARARQQGAYNIGAAQAQGAAEGKSLAGSGSFSAPVTQAQQEMQANIDSINAKYKRIEDGITASMNSQIQTLNADITKQKAYCGL